MTVPDETVIPRPGCHDPLPMTPKRILAILHRKEFFDVSKAPYSRPLLQACDRMAEAGLIRRDRVHNRRVYFALAPAAELEA